MFEVFGVGALGLPVPPVGVVYQRRLVPMAVRGKAGVFLQSVRFWTTGTGVVL